MAKTTSKTATTADKKTRTVKPLPSAIKAKLDNTVLVSKASAKIYAVLQPLTEDQRAEVKTYVFEELFAPDSE